MAMSEAQICNMALGRVGETQFIDTLEVPEDPSEDSAAAEQCRTYYAQARDETLERAPWPFAMRRKRLTAYSGDEWATATSYGIGDVVSYASVLYRSIADANAGNQPDESPGSWLMLNDARWLYAYPLPSDCITPRRIGLAGGRSETFPIPFDVKGDFDAEGNQAGNLLLTDEEDADLEYTARVENPAVFPAAFASAIAFRLAAELALSLRKDPQLSMAMAASWERAVSTAQSVTFKGTNPGSAPLPPHVAIR